MNKRPLSITIIGWLFITSCGVGLLYHLTEINAQHPFDHDVAWVVIVRLLAVLGGVLLLRGVNGARWLLAVWMAYHLVLSALHSPLQLVVHSLLFTVIGYFLFHPRASAYFRLANLGPQSSS
jgi:hypothetical protein